jgi:hypothetical protein
LKEQLYNLRELPLRCFYRRQQFIYLQIIERSEKYGAFHGFVSGYDDIDVIVCVDELSPGPVVFTDQFRQFFDSFIFIDRGGQNYVCNDVHFCFLHVESLLISLDLNRRSAASKPGAGFTSTFTVPVENDRDAGDC